MRASVIDIPMPSAGERMMGDEMTIKEKRTDNLTFILEAYLRQQHIPTTTSHYHFLYSNTYFIANSWGLHSTCSLFDWTTLYM